MNEDLKVLSIQDEEAVKNSYYRAPRKVPHIERTSQETLIVKTVDHSTTITKIEEVILYIISLFKYSPFWLVQQWFFDIYNNNGYGIISQWVNVGLVWAETTSMGIFLRPTRFLLDLYKDDSTKFIEIPFGLLDHTCAEQRLVFDIMVGNPKSELWNIIKEDATLPVYHPLEIKPQVDSGTSVIMESDFRIGYRRYDASTLLKREEIIEQQMRAGIAFSEEFKDFSYFPIVTIKKDTGEIVTQTPDIIVPIPRKEGKPMSYAIELELSPKTAPKYIGIMENYKNNIKFGKLFYLCGSQRIAKLVKDAYKKVGGLGNCEIYLVPFTAPSQKLSDYSLETLLAQQKLEKQSQASYE